MKNEMKLLMEINPVVPEKDEKYDDYIQRIKATRKNKKYKYVYMERHHIIPRSWNGSNEKENLIYLLGQEHYYAHKILALENPHDKNMIYGWWAMSSGMRKEQRGYLLSAEEYAFIRDWHFKIRSGENHPNSIPVICLETNKEYANVSVAAKELGLKRSVIHMVCSDKELNITAKRLHFLYKKNYTKEKAEEILNLKNGWDAKKIEIYCVETGEVFESITEAAKFANRNEANIRAVLYGRIETSGKDENGNRYHWRYVDENKNVNLRSCKKPKKVICENTGEVYNSVKEAIEKLKVKEWALRWNLEGHSKTVAVYIDGERKRCKFSYYEENKQNEGDK